MRKENRLSKSHKYVTEILRIILKIKGEISLKNLFEGINKWWAH